MAGKTYVEEYQVGNGQALQAALRAIAELGYTKLGTDSEAGIIKCRTRWSLQCSDGREVSIVVVPVGDSRSRVQVTPQRSGELIDLLGEKRRIAEGLLRKIAEQVQ